jgi:membrane-associated phospholipid phosphatase
VHYLSDVIIGWLIGIIVAILAIALLPVMQNLLPFMF